MKLLVLLLAPVALLAADNTAARVIFSKSFPGSTPPYVQITISKSGEGLYQEEKNDEDPLKFQLTDAEAAQIFDLAGKLDHFAHALESGLKVANMGKKTFRWEGDGDPHEETFNYSEDLNAKTLNDLFESISESERARIGLENSVRFDKLGVQDAILRIEVLRDQKRLIAQAQFLPMLDRVAKNESFMNMARERAATLADNIRAGK